MKTKTWTLAVVLLIVALPTALTAMSFVSGSSLLAAEVTPAIGASGGTVTFPGGELNTGGVTVPGINTGAPGGTALPIATTGGNDAAPGGAAPSVSVGGTTVSFPGGELNNGGVSIPGGNTGTPGGNDAAPLPALGCSTACVNGECVSTCDGENPGTGATVPAPEVRGLGACVTNCLGGTGDLAACINGCLGNNAANGGEAATTATALPFDGATADSTAANACTNVLVDASEVPVELRDFAAPFAPADESLQMGVFCDANGAKISIGDDADTTYIKRTVYTATETGRWTPVDLAGEGVQDMSWVKGSARGNLPISASTTGEYHFVIAYMCHWENNTWACGCSNDSCDNSKWNIQAYIRR